MLEWILPRPVWRAWRMFILEWALKEINLTHEDVPRIVLELEALRMESAV